MRPTNNQDEQDFVMSTSSEESDYHEARSGRPDPVFQIPPYIGMVVLALLVILSVWILIRTQNLADSTQLTALQDKVDRLEQQLAEQQNLDAGAMPTATAEQDLVVIDQRIAKLESEMVSRLDQIINQLGAPPATTSEKPTAKPAAEKPPKKEVAEATPEVHIVQAGDTLYRISRRYNVSVENLREYNQLQAGAAIYPGQKLKLGPPQAD